MTAPIISLTDWFQTPPGGYLLSWEQVQFDLAVTDLFGFNALQLGLPQLHTLRSNRMPHRWLALPEEAHEAAAAGHMAPPETPALLVTAQGVAHVDSTARSTASGAAASLDAAQQGPRVALVTNAAALPFPAASLDLVVLPHTLELSADPHHVLREVERVLVPEGRVVLSGFNPISLWGLRQARARWAGRLGVSAMGLDTLFLPEAGEFIGVRRLRDWLRLLSFEIETERYGCYRPAVGTERWLQRTQWMDRSGPRWWPIFGAVYFQVAVKRVRGVRLLGPAWKPRRAAASAAPASVTHRH